MPAHKHSDSDIERAYQHRIVKGKTLKKTAEIIGVAPKTITLWANEYGWKDTNTVTPKMEQAHNLYVVEGKPLKQVAEAVSVTPETITRWIAKHNWKRKADFKFSYEIGKISFAGFRDFLKGNHPALSAEIDETIELYIDIQKRYEVQVQEKINSQSHE